MATVSPSIGIHGDEDVTVKIKQKRCDGTGWVSIQVITEAGDILADIAIFNSRRKVHILAPELVGKEMADAG